MDQFNRPLPLPAAQQQPNIWLRPWFCLRSLLQSWLQRWQSPQLVAEQLPLREQLLSAEQMELRGKALAQSHQLSVHAGSELLLSRLADNEQVLLRICSLLTQAVQARQRIAPAGEWLLDNFYLIEEQISTARQHLPKGYSRELSRLATGPSAGLPRVYDLALTVISHGDGRVDDEALGRFVLAYQTVTDLTLGELWAIPIMLRLALLENLRRVSARLAVARQQQALAQNWADQMMTMAESDPKNLILVIADMARSQPPLVSPFVAELARRLQGHGPALALPLTWIEQRLAESSQTIEQLVRSETQQQAADQVSISNSIGSLRFLGASDWRVFVEQMSVVEQQLLQDPPDYYRQMAFASRDCYRQVIDRLAKQSGQSEAALARLAIDLSVNAQQQHGARAYQAHVGYYLIDDGFALLLQAAGVRRWWPQRSQQQQARLIGLLQAGAIVTATGGFTTLFLLHAVQAGLGQWQLGLLTLLLLLAGSQLASVLVNWLATLLTRPDPLPRLDFSQGLPATETTLVVIPSLLHSAAATDALLEALEVRFLGNQDPYLYFALLTDFTDADSETLPADQGLLDRMQAGIQQLNQRYASVFAAGKDDDSQPTELKAPRFLLFHRPRLWNAVAKRWMGYERKRGKLAALNHALRGSDLADFSLVVGDVAALGRVQYVITLDTDTQLPRDSARQFIATMAHPLNQPRFATDPDQSDNPLVIGGYGLLQPRMATSLSGANSSGYARLFSSEAGLDPYTRTVSDVYQDMYGEGSFVGKGIYQVDAFRRVLEQRFPDNRILSHDLIEGCYLRSGLLSDVQLYEDYPASYQTDVRRQQRWIRGDWQLLAWLLPKVPTLRDGQVRNPLSLLSRWKIFDNLRRSLVPATLLSLLLFGWLATDSPLLWTLTVTGLLLLPGWFIAAVSLFGRHADMRWSYHFHTVYQQMSGVLQEASFKLAVLPYEAGFSLHAIGCSLYRQWWAPQRLLDWTSSDQPVVQSLAPPVAQSVAQPQLASFYRRMRLAPALALLMLLLLSSWQPAALPAALPVLLLWALAPLYAWWLSRPLQQQAVSLEPEQRNFLWQSARQTWAFFQTFVTAEQHWLAPDNFQQKPGPVLAHRTSPTNIGLSLLANLSAYDFGFIGPAALLQRTADTFGTLAKLERYQGHFCNWYDTQSLQTLAPRYVSAVDSGNLAGHLLTLKAGLQNLPAEAILPRQSLQGLLTCLQLVQAAFDAEKKQLSLTVTMAFTLWSVRQQQLLEQAMATSQTEHSLTTSYCCLEQLKHQDQLLLMLPGLLPSTLQPTDQACTELQFWLYAWSAQHQALLAELSWLCPWLASGERPQRSAIVPALTAGQSSSLVPAKQDSHLLLQHCVAAMAEVETLVQLQQMAQSWLPQLAAALQSEQTASLRHLLASWLQYLQCAQLRAGQRQQLGQTLQLQCEEFANQEYEFLFDKSRHLLAVGYNIDEFRRDNSFYDLLASEARLATFVAISQGKLPQQSWFALGRLLTSSAGAAVLVSWSGSMFEYLMPLLVMPSYPGTLLEHSCRVAVQRQIAYGQLQSLPWGVSESGFSTVDASQNYQYHAFGVPGLGLKRGLAEDIVIAPYASMLALLVDASAACQNLQRLALAGAMGRYGFYEAIDYTPSRLSRGQSRSLVCSFMAHHQGMSLLAMASVLLDQPMQKRFASDPQFQATLLLLQEKVPKSTIVHAHVAEHSQGGAFFDAPVLPIPRPLGAATLVPEVQLLSNGRYHVMLTNAGGGYSHWHQLALTRWREDCTRDHWGSFLYVRDLASGHFWSAAHQPTLVQADSYAAVFSEGRAEFRRREHDFETYSEIVVSPEDDIELRRVRITNRASSRRTVELTSYSEVVLAAAAADDMQTAFGNLFVQTEILPERHAILCTRRPRSAGEVNCWMFHLLAQNGTAVGAVSYETDRMRFIGRGRTLQAPLALAGQSPLSGAQGAVLDPIVAIRCLITLDAEQTACLDWISGVAASRAECLALVDKYQDRRFADRVFDIAGTHSAVMLRQINASEADAELYRRLASAVLYSHSQLRADATILQQNRRGQAGLWGYAISGDLPIVLLKISDINQMELARQLIQCHAYWRLKGLAVDLVIWNEDHVGYRQQLQEQILGLIATGTEAQVVDRPGGIFVRMSEQIPNEDRILLQAVARAILMEQRGSLEEQLNRRALLPVHTALLQPQRFSHQQPSPEISTLLPADLQLGNGIGGFSPDGREYCLVTNHSQTTPLPWVNVLANPQFGTVITESGLAYSWSENAHEFRLTPWSDDSVAASGGEAFYLRDDDSGDFWSPTAWPCCGKQPYLIRHGFGYSQFEHEEWAIQSQLLVYVHPVDKVKFSVLTVRNQSARSRKISATGYVQWVLGDLAAKTAAHLVTEIDASSGALFARNSYHSEFSGRVAFFDVDDSSRSLTADRAEFIGRNGSLASPEAMRRSHLSGRVGAALDPCAAIQLAFTLAPGQQRQIIFRLGAGHDLADARALAARCRQTGAAAQALFAVKNYWAQTLSVVQLETPDPALNVLANGWLLYQTLACRLWARSGYYQSGGAFGFRDQLQDVQALLHADPKLAKQQIVLAASRQYENGDVQHWWHPPYGRGVRTRCSDDYLWLVATTCRYVRHSGDTSILQTDIGFLTGRPLNPDEASYYDLPQRAVVSASLYQHCVLAIEYGLKFGQHGLPLMGSGDWNDGMDLVGVKGKGESVWLGFFLYQVLHEFMPLATAQGDLAFVDRCQQAAAQLQQNLQLHGWDGDWFRRAYFDDGTVLGSAANSECRIDAIAQSWAVLSGATEPTRMWQAMNALDSQLIRRNEGLMQLLTPPFDQSELEPGYIKGYLPGVRENGGQYTHAAIWAAMAFARLGDPERCYQLLNLINPVQHGNSAAKVAIYRAEPYVMAADVYASPQHVGRAGWSWYTGSAGWMYQLILGSVAGIQREGDFLRITPGIPAHWPGFQLRYRFGSTEYQLQLTQQQQAADLTSNSDEVANPRRTVQIWLDGVATDAGGIWLQDDQRPHQIRVELTWPE